MGTAVYVENHFINTDALGLFNLNVGTGGVQSGTFASIDWSNDNYYLKVGLDASGGTNFVTMGTTQLLSVPYALYAKSAGGSFVHYPGELYGGGVVFHVYKDGQGREHGLIVAPDDLNANQGVIWSNIDTIEIGATAHSRWDGATNTAAIIAQAGHTNSAALLCKNYNGGGFTDWYLPSIEEWERLYDNRFDANRGLRVIGSIPNATIYWSSSEFSNHDVSVIDWMYGVTYYFYEKYALNNVRPIRAF